MTTISNYQYEGALFLTQRRAALLADDMGVGKSAQAVIACDMINAKRILVICPAVARINWKREFSLWSIFERNFTICEKLSDPLGECSIVSYDYATENADKIRAISWDAVVSDECHFIKEIETQRTIAILGVNGIIRSSKFFWALSGTPAPNHVGELWPLLYTFGATTLSYQRYIDEYCNTRPTYYGGVTRYKVTGSKKAKIPEVKALLKPIMLRRMKSDVLTELPPISFQQIYVAGTPLVDVVGLDMAKVEAERKLVESALTNNPNIDEVIERLGNSVSSLRRYVGLQKVQSVIELVTSELEAGAYEKIGIFAIHTDVIAQLNTGLKKFRPVVINGSVSPKNRQKAIDDFQTNKACKVFLGNIVAAGTAITLTASHQGLFIEESWVPGENLQAAMRFHRRGQTLPVTIRCASLADSIDERVTSTLIRKTEELSELFDSNTQKGA